MVQFSLGGALCGTAKFRSANNHHHHLQAGHQAQHGGVRHLGTKVGTTDTHMGGKTKSGQTEGKNDKVPKRPLEAVGVSEKFNVVQVNL